MTPEEQALWTAVYAGVIGGVLSGPHGMHYVDPYRRPSMDGQAYLETISRTARVCATRAVEDLREVRASMTPTQGRT